MMTAILIPSLGRSQHVKRTVGNIEANTPEPHLQIWCVSGAEYTDQLDELGVLYLDDGDDPDKRYVTRMNKLAAKAIRSRGIHQVKPDFEYLFFGSDDVTHHPFWLKNALLVMEEAPNAQVVVVNDLRNPNGTQALVRASYIPQAVFDDDTAAFHPGYKHNFADTEMFETAATRGVIYRAMDSHVEHLHPAFGKASGREWDQTYIDAQAMWNEDAERFHRRMDAMRAALT
jgi:hypothetical protein